MEEVWKDIPDYEGKYQVSNHGRVRSLDMVVNAVHNGTAFSYAKEGRILKQKTDNGYKYVTLTHGSRINKRNYSVHRLVAFAFVPGYFNGAQVNHINEVRSDNRPSNLEWVTPKANINHGYHNHRVSITKGSRVVQYDKQGNEIQRFPSLARASLATGIARENIGKCCNHKDGWITAGGYVWEFEGNPFMLRTSTAGKSVAQYTKDGQYIATYPSIKAAAAATGANAAVISKVLDTRYRAKKFLWKSV